MKVVLFCGGLGMRLREYSEQIPKPMVPIGYRPILWHLMKYYAHYGYNDFILCLGYRADSIKNYFLDYNEAMSNDFVLSQGGDQVQLLNRDIADWRITFVDTGTHTNIAGRLKAVREHLAGEEFFMANYADGLCDLPLRDYVDAFVQKQKVACFVSVRPTTKFHIVNIENDGIVKYVQELGQSDVWMNGGFFILRQEIFDYIKEGEELVNEPFERLIEEEQLISQKYDGFWLSMDTFKDKQVLDEMYARGEGPWEVWKKKGEGEASPD
jgi:glucose-1-phosphate cytidylyltransferase